MALLHKSSFSQGLLAGRSCVEAIEIPPLLVRGSLASDCSPPCTQVKGLVPVRMAFTLLRE